MCLFNGDALSVRFNERVQPLKGFALHRNYLINSPRYYRRFVLIFFFLSPTEIEHKRNLIPALIKPARILSRGSRSEGVERARRTNLLPLSHEICTQFRHDDPRTRSSSRDETTSDRLVFSRESHSDSFYLLILFRHTEMHLLSLYNRVSFVGEWREKIRVQWTKKKKKEKRVGTAEE